MSKYKTYKVPNSAKILFLSLIIILMACEQNDQPLLEKIQGSWINKQNDFIEIQDTLSNNNFIGKNAGTIGKYLQIINDTLSFQNRYTSSIDYFSTNRIDRSDFRVNTISDTFLSISPLSVYSRKIFHNDTIKFTKQNYAIDTDILFEKITFHTTHCNGHCPTYHLEISENGITRLHKEKVYKLDHRRIYINDSLKVGYYTGKISDKTLNLLNHYLRTCNLDNLKFDEDLCCDGSIITIIVSYNGRRKYLRDMFPPRIAKKLIDHLYHICEDSELQKSNIKFELGE